MVLLDSKTDVDSHAVPPPPHRNMVQGLTLILNRGLGHAFTYNHTTKIMDYGDSRGHREMSKVLFSLTGMGINCLT